MLWKFSLHLNKREFMFLIHLNFEIDSKSQNVHVQLSAHVLKCSINCSLFVEHVM